MSVDVITLGPEGKLSDINAKIDYLMCCFFFSKASQSTLFYGSISSLPKIIQEAGSDEIRVREDLQTGLQKYLGIYFTRATVDVQIDPDVYPSISLQLNLIVSDAASIDTGGVSVGYSLLVNDSKLKSILNITASSYIYGAA
jgi:hypothetical protein